MDWRSILAFLRIYGFNDYIAEGDGARGRRGGIGMVQKKQMVP